MRSLLTTSIAAAIRIVATIGMIAILARALSFELFSTISIGILSGQLLSVIIDGGINNEILRHTGIETAAQHRLRLTTSAAIRLLIMPLPLTGLYCLVKWLEISPHPHIVILATMAGLLGSIGESYFMSLRATGKHQKELRCSALLAVFMLTVPWLVIPWPSLAGVAVLLPRLLNLVNLIDFPRDDLLGALRKNSNPNTLISHYYRIRHYYLDSVVSNAGIQLDSILIALLLGPSSYALYQPTSRLFMGSLTIAPIVAGLSLPKAARIKPPRKALTYLLTTFATTGLGIAALLLPALAWATGPIFGTQFQLNYSVAVLLSLSVLMRFLAAGSGSYLTLRDNQKRRAWINGIITLTAVPPALIFGHTIETILLITLASQLAIALTYTKLAHNLLDNA